jgi:hypothetical protein
LALRFISWLSIKLALAGKIAGKARKRPPMPGPKRFAIKPAATVDKPPNTNRTAYSCGLVSLREGQSPRTANRLTTIPPIRNRITGDVALKDDKPAVHAHAVVGKKDGTAHGGHLLEARVRPVLTESPTHLQKFVDPESGLALIKP